MRVEFRGTRGFGVTAKDLVLTLIRQIGTAGATGHFVEYAGDAIRALSMEGRMTVCNMTVEAGARAGLVAADDTTFAYLEGRPRAPKGADWERALERWRSLPSDPDATFDREVTIDAASLRPYVSWGTNPGQCVTIDDVVPEPSDEGAARALAYMDLAPGTPIREIRPDTVFIGSCTNSRIEDLRVHGDQMLGGRGQGHLLGHPGVEARSGGIVEG